MERCDTDLRKVCKDEQGVTMPQVRRLTYGLLSGLKYLHETCVYHWDLKPANCLVNRSDCCVKIGDFNLARTVATAALEADALETGRPQLRRALTKHVATRWHRPPEVILQLEYSEAMDVWSAGCIIAELFLALDVGPKGPRGGIIFPATVAFLCPRQMIQILTRPTISLT